MKFKLGGYLHTYTIIGRCPRTLQFGVGITTYSLGVGGYCPQVRTHVGAISSQAYADPQLGVFGMRLLDLGYSADNVLKQLEEEDEFFQYRQIGIVGKDGTARCHTGTKNLSWAGHLTGDGYVAMGNALTSERTVQAIAETFEESEGENLDERLLRSIEAGRDAGGQNDRQSNHLTERSSGLVLHYNEEYPLMDIRVDAHDKAVDELRRIHTIYAPYTEYMEVRTKNPPETPSQDDWAKKRGVDW